MSSTDTHSFPVYAGYTPNYDDESTPLPLTSPSNSICLLHPTPNASGNLSQYVEDAARPIPSLSSTDEGKTWIPSGGTVVSNKSNTQCLTKYIKDSLPRWRTWTLVSIQMDTTISEKAFVTEGARELMARPATATFKKGKAPVVQSAGISAEGSGGKSAEGSVDETLFLPF
jgi:hypothetical protein